MASSRSRFFPLAAVLLLAFAAAAEEPSAAGKPLDDAALAALGIRPGDVAPDDGSWSWTSGAYQYDGSGNITAIGTQSYAYDAHGRLVGATLTRPDQPGSQQHTYTYDAAGNMVSRTAVMTTINTPTDLDTNHLTGLSAAYDAAGNIVQLKPPGQAHTYQYTYDPLGALQKVTVADIASAPTRYNVYTADDERLWTFDGPTNTSRWTIRDLSGKVLRDYTFDFVSTTAGAVPRWQLSRDYIYRDGMLLAAVTPSSTLHFSLDHLGSPRVVTDPNRLRLGFHHYLPFGEEWLVNAQASDSEPMKYTGHERDGDLAGGAAATDYMHARHYTGGVGRFLSIDPVCGLIEQPQSWNRYAYALNNPLMYTDPSGRYPCKVKLTGQDARDAGVPDGTEVDGVCVEARDPAKEDQKNPKQRPMPQVVPMMPSSAPVRPDGPVTMLTRQLFDAFDTGRAFLQNYTDMREANTVGADRYFHCMANCQGARAGAYGAGISERFSNAREVWDQNVKRFPRSDSHGDQAANAAGRNGATSLPCQTVCAGFRPAGLSARY